MIPHPPLAILLAERDDTLRTFLVEQLTSGGAHHVTAVPDLDGVVAALRRQPVVDVIMLDASLDAEETATEVLDDADLPTILLLPAPGGAPAGNLMERGADALLGKPFRLAVLLDHLRAVSARPRRPAPADGGMLAIGPHILDLRTRILQHGDGGGTVRLTGKEVEILTYLHKADGPIGREALLDAVWGYRQGIDTHTLETHIYRLRRKIEVDPAHAVLLVTEPGGYRLAPCD